MKTELRERIRDELSRHAGTTVSIAGSKDVSGGSINAACVIDTNIGTFFVKTNARAIDDQFECEAAGLRALDEARSSLEIPEPVIWRDWSNEGPGFLVVEYLEPGPQVSDFAVRLGRGLAELHKNRAEAFGFHTDNYCGATPQPNSWMDDWIEFYRSQRLEHQLELGSYDSSGRRTLMKLLDRLDELLSIDPEPPALLHGDLWSGNLHTTSQGLPALIDPAVYYGNREAELGMMKLFGGFSQGVWDAYDEAYPLQTGWRERLPLYELYHVMNHNTLFGGGYARQAVSIARRYV